METTKITSASVRIALAFNYSTFEVSLNLDNPDGIQASEVNDARLQAYELAKTAVEEVRINPLSNPREELKKIDNKLAQIRKLVDDKKPEPEPKPEEVEAIKNLPEYTPKATGKSKSKMKTPNDIAGLGADD